MHALCVVQQTGRGAFLEFECKVEVTGGSRASALEIDSAQLVWLVNYRSPSEADVCARTNEELRSCDPPTGVALGPTSEFACILSFHHFYDFHHFYAMDWRSTLA